LKRRIGKKEKNESMKILVTGGTGFTGSHLTSRLIQKGHNLVVLDNQRGLFFDKLKNEGAEILIGSVADRALVKTAAKDCSLVYHVAAAFRRVNLARKVYWDVNVEGTRNVLEAARHWGAEKVVYCSTCGVHGDVKGGSASEDSPIAPEDYYQLTKYEGEKVVAEYVKSGMKVVTLRPTAIYGPGDPERFLMLFKMVASGRFFMFGNGEVHYHPLYIDNLIDAFELAASSDRNSGEGYLIGDEKYCTLNELVSGIAEVLGVRLRIRHLPFWPLWTAALACEVACKPFPVDPPLFRRRVDWFRQNRAFSIDRAKRELGYQPKVDLRTGLKRTAEWYTAKGYI
jgi:nucleoside-diphosphate-sugar epimerase